MTKLTLSSTLEIPLDACTQTFAWIGRKGSGKTYGAGKMVEELLDQHVQVVILDTVGNWYGLRIHADGSKECGYEIPVFGGLRQDLPLLPTAGDVVADVVVDSGRSVILDVSQFNFSDRKRFAADFGTRLWQRKKGESQPSPLHLVIEECQLIVPQFVGKDETRMVHVYEEIIRLGRNYGIGVSMITQRPQSVNKEVLTQAECIMAFQINGVPERKALKEWLTYEGGDVNLVNDLPGLPVGTCYLWSPQWLRTFKRLTIAKKWTLDTSATPKMGAKVTRRELEPLDVKDIEARMTSTIEKAKADDPKQLRAKIAQLERELQKGHVVATPQVQIKEIPVITDKDFLEFGRMAARVEAAIEKASATLDEPIIKLKAELVTLQSRLDTYRQVQRHDVARPVKTSRHVTFDVPKFPSTRKHVAGNEHDNSALTTVQRKFLTALAQQDRALTRNQVAIFAGYSAKSRHVDNTLASLRATNYVQGGREGIEITDVGRTALGAYNVLPTGDGLRQYWLTELDRAASVFLEVLCQSYPQSLTRDELAERAGYSPQSRHVDNTLAQLRSRDLVQGGRQAIMASKELFT